MQQEPPAADLSEAFPSMMVQLSVSRKRGEISEKYQQRSRKSLRLQQQVAKPLPLSSGSVSTPCQTLQYDHFLTATGFNKRRTIWMGDLRPLMDKDYFTNFFKHYRKEDAAIVIKNNEQTGFPEYAFIQFKTTKEAYCAMLAYNGLPMPNSRQTFNFKWATVVCGLKAPHGRDVPEFSRISVSTFLTLVSIEFVRVNHIRSSEHPAKLFGTVTLGRGLRHYTVYDRSSKDCQSILPGQHLVLTGPIPSMEADDGFFIRVDLMWDDGKKTAKGEILWHPEDLSPYLDSHRLDRCLDENVSNGKVTVSYSVIKYALNAIVEVLLIKGADVYGTIDALQFIGESKTCHQLFVKSETEYVRVCSNVAIPLTRSVVVIPRSGLSIKVHLMDHGTGGKIVEKEVLFAAVPGTKTERIGCELEVSLTCY